MYITEAFIAYRVFYPASTLFLLAMVKGNILKVKRQTKIADNKIFTDAIESAKKISNQSEMSFRHLLNGLSSDDLTSLKKMFEHGKQQNTKKLEKAIEWSKEFQNLVSVKEFLEDAISRARDLLHDGIIRESSDGDEGSFKIVNAIKMIDIINGIKDEKEMMQL